MATTPGYAPSNAGEKVYSTVQAQITRLTEQAAPHTSRPPSILESHLNTNLVQPINDPETVPSVSSNENGAAADRPVPITRTPSMSRSDFDKNIEKVSDATARIWRYYRQQTDIWDSALLENCDKTLDVFLLFTTLFSAVVAPFLLASIPMLQPDLQRATLNALLQISAQLPANENAATADVTYPPEDAWLASSWPLAINVLWSIALVISLVSAVFAMLVKRWIVAYKENLTATSADNIHDIYSKSLALRTWGVSLIVTSLPLWIHIAVTLFLIGLMPFTWHVSTALGAIVTTTVLVSLVLYGAVSILPSIFHSCPYGSPLSEIANVCNQSHLVKHLSKRLDVLRHRLGSLLLARWQSWKQGMVLPAPVQAITRYESRRGHSRIPILQNMKKKGSAMSKSLNVPEDDSFVLQGFVRNLVSQGWPIQEDMLISLVGWKVDLPTWKAMESQLSIRARPAIASRLAATMRSRTDPSELHNNLATLAAMSSILGRTGFSMDDEHRDVLYSWVFEAEPCSLPTASSLLVCAFLLFSEGAALTQFSKIKWRHKKLVFITWERMLTALKNPESFTSCLLGFCLVFEFFQRYGLHVFLPVDELATFLQGAEDLPSEWLAAFLATLKDFPFGRRLYLNDTGEELNRRFMWIEDPGPMVVEVFEKSRSRSHLQEEDLTVFRSLLAYTGDIGYVSIRDRNFG
ncbi:hypothetical protein CALCODRAFT_124029 [Calocera cornea HHB12733]|uniref:DUF6535 domain-containing protein n=1 Tax=Calocera cornea HHB12733 TaxID=1353952 RepID=A0A165CXG3_9BASI|nr:hypothetical protein CALCODRAFT_124029 [Calocera cornea HHB12733]